jgi:His/Glu/Gln/Arg/opine family amino acid ABC transporter permease subunit
VARLKPRRGTVSFSTGSLLLLLVTLAALAAYASGALSFLANPTGWQLGFSLYPQHPIDPYWKTILLSVANTVTLAATAILLATLTGTLMAILVIGENPLWSPISRAYIQVFRNTPLLLQALLWFAIVSHAPRPNQGYRALGFVVSNRGLSLPVPTFAGIGAVAAFALVAGLSMVFLRKVQGNGRRWSLACVCGLALSTLVTWIAWPAEPLLSFPQLRGFNFTGGAQVPTEFLALLVALTIFGSAYVAEIVRGGFTTVPAGVIEAARALALPGWVIELKVRIPIALRALLLPLGSQYTTLLKATSIGLAVGFTDLFAVTLMSINHSGHTIALLLSMSFCFVVLNQLIVSLFNALNRAVEIPGYGSK